MRQSVQRDIVLATIALGRSAAGRFFCVAWGTTARLRLCFARGKTICFCTENAAILPARSITSGDFTAAVLRCGRHCGGVIPSPADFCTAVPAALCSGRAAEVASA